VIAEATAVQEHGRISLGDTGIYNDAHVESWRPIAEFIRVSGAVAGMQLAHAGRKASTAPPWQRGKPVAIGKAVGRLSVLERCLLTMVIRLRAPCPWQTSTTSLPHFAVPRNAPSPPGSN
jgi:2,4-dienoyl-CoA reductase-like NADH-dependent reductase (Old Yellow Enzyme family)